MSGIDDRTETYEGMQRLGPMPVGAGHRRGVRFQRKSFLPGPCLANSYGRDPNPYIR